MTCSCDHLRKRDAIGDSQGRKLSANSKRLATVYRKNVLAFYRAVRGWLAMMRRAIQYGVQQQLVLGKEPDLNAVPDWSAYRPPATDLDRLFEDRRVAKFVKMLAKADAPIDRIDDVSVRTAEASAYSLADWGCIKYHGEKQLYQSHMRIYGQAMGQAAQIARISTTWDVVNRQAVDWALARSSALVTLVTDETKAALRSVIGDGIAQGKSMAKVAEEIMPLVGLNERQAGALAKYREEMERLHGAGSRKAEKLVQREAEKKHAYRAEMIARTETARSVSEGTIAGYREANVKRMRFEASLDACEICSGYDGQEWGLLEGEGLIPVHPSCVVGGWSRVYTLRGWVPIRDVKLGDLVWTHRERFRPVTQLHVNARRDFDSVKMWVGGHGTPLELTADHPVWFGISASRPMITWRQAAKLLAGSPVAKLVWRGERETFDWVAISRLERKRYAVKTVYNLSVAEDESYVVGGVVVHNCRCTWTPVTWATEAFNAPEEQIAPAAPEEKIGGGDERALAEVARLAEDFPQLNSMSIEVADTEEVTPPGGEIAERFGYYDPNTGHTVVAGGPNALAQEQASALGGELVDPSFEGAVRHESGHHVYERMGASNRAEWEGAYGMVDDPSRISGVAMQSPQEAFSEAFAHFTSRDYDKDLPGPLHDYFMELRARRAGERGAEVIARPPIAAKPAATPPLAGLDPAAVGARLEEVGKFNVDWVAYKDKAGGQAPWLVPDAAVNPPLQAGRRALANEGYKMLGLGPPEYVVAQDGNAVIMAIHPEAPGYAANLEAHQLAQVLKDARRGFGADAWLNNAPFGQADALVDGGKLMRAGRAAFGPLGDYRVLLDPNVRPVSARMYAGLTDKEIAQQFRAIGRIRDKQIKELVDRVVERVPMSAADRERLLVDLKARRTYLRDEAKRLVPPKVRKPKIGETTKVSDPSFVSGKIKSSQSLGESSGVNGSYKVAIDGDGDGIYKPASGEYGMPGTSEAGQELRAGLESGTMYKREVAASILDKHLGFEIVPETVIKGGAQGVGSVQKWAETAKPTSAYNDAREALPVLERAKLNAFDMLIGNTDRHGGNLLLDGVPTTGRVGSAAVGRVVAIDNGCAFTTNADIKRGGFKIRMYVQAYDFPAGYQLPAELHGKLAALQKNWPAVEKDLAPLIEKRGLEDTKRRLDALVAHPEKFRDYTRNGGGELLYDAMSLP